MESQPQYHEFRNNPENFHPTVKRAVSLRQYGKCSIETVLLSTQNKDFGCEIKRLFLLILHSNLET